MEDILNRKNLSIILDALDDFRQRVGDEVEEGDLDESDYREVCSLHGNLLKLYNQLSKK